MIPDLSLVCLARMLERDHGPSALATLIHEEARPAEACRRIFNDAEIDLEAEQAMNLVILLASGASAATIAIQLGNVVKSVAHASIALTSAWPDLKRHLADRSLEQLARSHQIESCDLDALVGGPGPSQALVSFFHRYVGTGLSKEIIPGLKEKQVVERIRRNVFVDCYVSPAPTQIKKALGEFKERLFESVVNSTNCVFNGLSWTEARSIFLQDAEAAILAAAFAVIKSGHRIVALTQKEFLVEVPQQQDYEAIIAGLDQQVRNAVSHVLGGDLIAKTVIEKVERW